MRIVGKDPIQLYGKRKYDLEPCIYCGNKEETLLGLKQTLHAEIFVECACCESRGPTEELEDKAVAMWNNISKWVYQ